MWTAPGTPSPGELLSGLGSSLEALRVGGRARALGVNSCLNTYPPGQVSCLLKPQFLICKVRIINQLRGLLQILSKILIVECQHSALNAQQVVVSFLSHFAEVS